MGESQVMERGTYHIEFFSEGLPMGRPEPFTGFRLNAEHLASRKARRNGADFVRVLDDGMEIGQSVLMPRGPKGEKRPADVIGNAVCVMQIATGDIEERADAPKT